MWNDVDVTHDVHLKTVTPARSRAGQRQDNRVHERSGQRGKKGARFFQDDEDEFEVEVRHYISGHPPPIN